MENLKMTFEEQKIKDAQFIEKALIIKDATEQKMNDILKTINRRTDFVEQRMDHFAS